MTLPKIKDRFTFRAVSPHDYELSFFISGNIRVLKNILNACKKRGVSLSLADRVDVDKIFFPAVKIAVNPYVREIVKIIESDHIYIVSREVVDCYFLKNWDDWSLCVVFSGCYDDRRI
jgi:hypothetical protein